LFIGASLSVTSYVVTLSFGGTAQATEVQLLILRFVPLLLTSMAFALV
jgi:hypothetical protein